MKHIVLATLITVIFIPEITFAGTIERACLKTGRAGASRALCGCIQDAADLVLDKRDQRLAAKFFKDPHHAQEVRQSDRASNEAFWKRYKEFGATAEVYCKR